MAYIDYDFYINEYGGTSIDDTELFERLTRRAMNRIDVITNYKIDELGGLDSLPIFVKKQVQMATSAQVEFLVLNGETADESGSDIQNASIGNFSYSTLSRNANGKTKRDTRIAQSVFDFLSQTGLLYRGIATKNGGGC
jgi:hypothetical protein